MSRASSWSERALPGSMAWLMLRLARRIAPGRSRRRSVCVGGFLGFTGAVEVAVEDGGHAPGRLSKLAPEGPGGDSVGGHRSDEPWTSISLERVASSSLPVPSKPLSC